MSNNQQKPISEGTKRILNTVKDDLFPILNQLRKLLIDAQVCRIKFSFFSLELNKLESEYADISIRFFNVVRKLETPDILFEGLEDNPQNIAGYFQFQNAISKTINDGSNYIEIINRTLDRKRQSIQNARTLAFATIAILISVFSSIYLF